MIVAAVLAMTGLAFAGGSARAATSVISPPGGDFSITLTASDLGIDPSYLQTIVNQVHAQGTSLNQQLLRQMAEYSGDFTSANVPQAETAEPPNFNPTMSMTSDGTGIVVDLPAADVGTSATAWESTLAWMLGTAMGFTFRGGCMMLLAATGIGAALIPVVCTPFGGAVGGFFKAMLEAKFNNNFGSTAFWTNLILSVVGGAVGGFVWEKWLSPFFKGPGAAMVGKLGGWLKNQAPGVTSWAGSGLGDLVAQVGGTAIEMEPLLPPAVTTYDASLPAAGPLPCDVYDGDVAPCTAAYSMDRALYSYYGGPLYQVKRASDGTTRDIGLLSAGGYVNASEQDSFCGNTPCTITKLYDQSPQWNDLSVAPGGGAAPNPDQPASATALPITVNGHKAYGVDIEPGMGYRNNSTRGIAVNGQPEGMYMVASGTHANPACCFDFGNGEANSIDNHAAHMDAVNLSTTCWPGGQCTGNGPWVQADLEDGLFMGAKNTNLANLGNSSNFVTALLKNNGQTTFALKGGNSLSGGLSTWYDGPLPSNPVSYAPMKQEGGIILGTGGDNSNWGTGSFFEGVMTAGYPSDAADNAVQASVVAAGYAGNSAGVNLAASAAGPAVAHDGYASVYTVTSGGHLQETYDPAIGQPWVTQDMSVKFLTPKVMAGTKPVAVTHDGYTSVYTVDAGDESGHKAGDLQETFLPAIGDAWSTQDLSTLAKTPQTDMTPTAVYHDGYTSVYTVNRSDRHLWETFLPALGAGWTSQDLSGTNGPTVLAGTSPVAVYHDGYTSVYTVNGDDHLEETFLPALGAGWTAQDLTAKTKGPDTTVTPTAVYHSGYTSVYTVDKDDGGSQVGHLQETFLPAIGDSWSTQDLTELTSGPPVAPGTSPVALFHTGYTSVFTVDKGAAHHVEETFLPALGAGWLKQDMNTQFSTPASAQTPIVLLHADATGALTWTSLYTFDESTDDLQETYLTAIGQKWVTKTLTVTPPDADPDSPPAAGPAVAHDGYTSEYTVDTNGDLEETFLTAAGQPWTSHDLSTLAHTPAVMPGTKPEAVAHNGYTSVYTIDASNGDLEETYLSALGAGWVSQDLSSVAHTPRASWTPAAVFHDGYTSVYTIDAASGHLWETYLPALGAGWTSQDLTGLTSGPAALAGTSPAVVFHDGYTSVYTVDASHDLQETYLPALGAGWVTQDLSAKSGIPRTSWTPAAVFHDGYTSVYTVDDPSRDLQETYLPAIGDGWSTQDMTVKFGAPAVEPGTVPAAIYHTGYTSVYTVDQGSGDLQETFLPAIGEQWSTQDLSAKTSAPPTAESPVAVVHADASGGLTWTSVYTIDEATDHVRETYLQALGGGWVSKDLTPQSSTPPDAATDFPTAGSSVAHSGYTSMYTADSNGDLRETFLPAIGKSWATQDLSALTVNQKVMAGTTPVAVTGDVGDTNVFTITPTGSLFWTYLTAIGQRWSTYPLGSIYNVPASHVTPAAVFHDGYTSVYTVATNGDLWETYQAGINGPWVTQDLTALTGMPAGNPGTSPVAVFHDGYVSVFTIGKNGDLQETYLQALGAGWKTQDLSAIYHVPTSGIVSPGAVVHSGFVSVYTFDGNGDLQETYLPAIGDAWKTQDLTAVYHLPATLAAFGPVALYHTGYTSVYTVDIYGQLWETYLPAIGGAWTAVNMTATYHTPATTLPPSALLHYDASGGLTWTSLFTVDINTGGLDETYLPALGSPWTTQVLP